MSPRFASPRESGPSPTGSFLRAPAATAAWGLAAALGLGALGWAGQARLTDSETELPSAEQVLAEIEQAAATEDELSGSDTAAEFDESADHPAGSARIIPIEYLSPDELPIAPDESQPIPEKEVTETESEPGDAPTAAAARLRAEDEGAAPQAEDTLDAEMQTETGEEVAPEELQPEVNGTNSLPETPVATEPVVTEPVATESIPAEVVEPDDAPIDALPAAESLPMVPVEAPPSEQALNQVDEPIVVEPTTPSETPPTPNVAIPARNYTPKGILEVRLHIAPVKAGALPEQRSDPATATFPQGTRLVGTNSWQETSCYGNYLFICHDPLYFEDQVTERYGEHWGKWIQPAVSAGKFFGSVPMAPYKFFANSLSEECYGEDKYGQVRNGFAEGTFIPPFHAGAAALTAGAVTGLFFLVP
jgi:hypothetical protein